MWCVIVPTYNNGSSIEQVVTDILRHTRNVIVVDDGSTDNTAQILRKMGVSTVTHPHNMGKGAALKTGFRKALEDGFTHAVTIDADGQHFAKDIPLFTEAMERNPGALIVGCRNLSEKNMPQKNSFANRFSNFWFTVQTGIRLPDTQTGYRLYPLASMRRAGFITSRYEAELELLVFAAWHGIRLIPVKIDVYYPVRRISHFRPVYDFLRISLLNILLCFLAAVYGYPMKFVYCIKKRKKRQ